jgi:hypothetical protein
MKKNEIPQYALVISLWIPLGLALLIIILLVVPVPGLQSVAIAMSTFFLAIPGVVIFPFLNGLVAVVGGGVAKSKGRKFGTFYFLGVLVPVLPALVALFLKQKNL